MCVLWGDEPLEASLHYLRPVCGLEGERVNYGFKNHEQYYRYGKNISFSSQ